MKTFESVVSDHVQNLVKEDIQKTFQKCFPSLGKTDKKKGKKQREERVKNFLCDLYGWDKDTVEVEEVWENLYGVKTYYERYVFEMKVEEKE